MFINGVYLFFSVSYILVVSVLISILSLSEQAGLYNHNRRKIQLIINHLWQIKNYANYYMTMPI